jgi:hypothetical protein
MSDNCKQEELDSVGQRPYNQVRVNIRDRLLLGILERSLTSRCLLDRLLRYSIVALLAAFSIPLTASAQCLNHSESATQYGSGSVMNFLIVKL